MSLVNAKGPNPESIASWLDALDGVAEYAATKCAGAAEIAAVYRPRATRRMSYLRL